MEIPDPLAVGASAWRRLQAFHHRLLAEPSATAVLEHWCGGVPVQVVKRPGASRRPPPPLLAHLAAAADEPVAYRQVALVCAGKTVSEAENWYLPGRLEADMHHALAQSDRPFGRIVKSLDFLRETLGVDWLWQPGTAAPTELPWALLRHQAVLTRTDGQPFSVVIETYTRAVLSFELPAPGR